MRRFTRLLPLAAILLWPAPALQAQTAPDPSGHWEGSVQIPNREAAFELDLASNGRGGLSGTINNAAENIFGLPLREVAVDGRSVSFNARRDQPFRGRLSADGQWMSGEATLSGHLLPFTLKRTGDARIIPAATSAPIASELEGTWNGALDANGASMRLVLTIANQPDGTATARLVSLDEGELEVPLAITQKASSVTLLNSVIVSSFAGELNSEGTELAGTWTQGPVALPLTFRHVKGGR